MFKCQISHTNHAILKLFILLPVKGFKFSHAGTLLHELFVTRYFFDTKKIAKKLKCREPTNTALLSPAVVFRDFDVIVSLIKSFNSRTR